MDLRTGRCYPSPDDALADGVPESDIAEVKAKLTDLLGEMKEAPEVSVSPGPPRRLVNRPLLDVLKEKA